jgi:hypothetical protein
MTKPGVRCDAATSSRSKDLPAVLPPSSNQKNNQSLSTNPIEDVRLKTMLARMMAGVLVAALAAQIAPCGAFVGPALIAPCGTFAGIPAFRGIHAVLRPRAWALRAPRMVNAAPLVVVAGATGRVGRLVVQRLLNPPFNSTQTPVRVRALVRDLKKAESVLPQDSSLEIVRCDLLSGAQIKAACADAAAAVWCATGFSDSQDASLVSKLMGAFKLKFTPQESVDISAMKAMGACFKDRPSPLGGPSIVMCSSAGVTRPTWPEDKKQRLFCLPPPPCCLTACIQLSSPLTSRTCSPLGSRLVTGMPARQTYRSCGSTRWASLMSSGRARRRCATGGRHT